MAAKKAKKKTFSAVKAVKANARARVGQPRPEKIIVDTPHARKQKAKHKPSLAEIISSDD